MQRMNAIVQNGYGSAEQVLQLREVARPELRDDELLVRVRAASVNESSRRWRRAGAR